MRKQPLKVNQAFTQHWIPVCCKDQAGCQVFFKELGVYLGKIYFQKRGKQLSFSRSSSERTPLSPWCLYSSAREIQTLPWAGSPGEDQWLTAPSSFWEASSHLAGFITSVMTFGLTYQVQENLTHRPNLLQHCADLISPPRTRNNKKHSAETTSWGLETL